MRDVAGDCPPGLSGYDAELRRHNEILRDACAIRLVDRVLDIGFGAGQTTRQAARAAEAGSAVVIDTSVSAIQRGPRIG
jgi:ubiquinone/menaquinone biosynthesis C-methylase UbiE